MAKWKKLKVITGDDGVSTNEFVVDLDKVTHFWAPSYETWYCLFFGAAELQIDGDIKEILPDLEGLDD